MRPSEADPAASFRVLTYNVRSLRDDAGAVASVIRAVGPDVVCLQEAPRFLRSRTRCAALARHAGLLFAEGGREGAGTALLAALRVDVEDAWSERFPRTAGLHRRGVTVARLRLAGRPVVAASFHLGLDAAERLRHTQLVVDAVRALPADGYVLAGDVNEQPGGPAYQLLAEAFGDCWAGRLGPEVASFPSRAPDRLIDAVFVGGAVRVETCEVVAAPGVVRASDHLPVLATVTLARLTSSADEPAPRPVPQSSATPRPEESV